MRRGGQSFDLERMPFLGGVDDCLLWIRSGVEGDYWMTVLGVNGRLAAAPAHSQPAMLMLDRERPSSSI